MSKHCTSPTSTARRQRSTTQRSARRNAADLRSLAADRGYDSKAFKDELRRNSVHPLIKHRIYSSLNHAYNARIGDDIYHQRSMSESVFSSVKRSLGVALRVRIWYRKFRELSLMCPVYNIKKAAEQEIPIPSGD